MKGDGGASAGGAATTTIMMTTMTAEPTRRRRRRRLALLAAAALPAAAFSLYLVPPGAGPFYPVCPLYALTGLHCPGCGATRCLHALLHGDLAQAAAYNVLFLAALPFLVVLVLRAWFRAV